MSLNGRMLVVFVLVFPACVGDGGSNGPLAADLALADADCEKDPLACNICRTDDDCVRSGQGLRCDPGSKQCVGCLPFADNCPAGQVCRMLNQTWACLTTCASNNDCIKLGTGSLCCTGICVNPATDVSNCGVCGNACPPVPNGTPGCAEGRCIIALCNPGYDDCDKAAVNGCEAVVSADPNNCGKCGNVCKPFSNGLPTCTNGVCSAVCAPGYSDCN